MKYLTMGKWVTSKIYPINYLKNSDLTDEDLRNLLDKSSLILSLVIHEFRMIGDKREDWVILKEVKTEENWADNYFFNKNQRNKFIDDVSKVYRNIYMYDNMVCKRNAEHFALIFGFRIKN